MYHCRVPKVSLWRLTLIFLRTGILTLGGGEAMMSALQRELVERRQWLRPHHFALAYSLARVTPGTNVLAFCAAMAWFLRGWLAAVLAVLAATVPSAAIVVVLTLAYERLKSNLLAAGAISGLLAAAAGMMAAVSWNLIRPRLAGRRRLRTLALVVGSLILTRAFSLSPIAVLGLAALAGLLWCGPGPETASREPV